MTGLEARIARLEAIEEIRQLAARYAVALDMRDFNALANLFVDDVGVPGNRHGREAMREWYDIQMRGALLGSAHGVLGHVIDVHSADTASGLVYSRNDLETQSAWLIEMLAYLDSYERRDGNWYFARRVPLFWYRSDITDPPVGPRKVRWPHSTSTDGSFHDAFPSWEAFWTADPGRFDAPVPAPAGVGEWLRTLRRGAEAPRVSPTGRAVTES